MGSRGVGDIPTIFHPQQTHTPSIILGDNQQNHGSQNTVGQITHDNSGKSKLSYLMNYIYYINVIFNITLGRDIHIIIDIYIHIIYKFCIIL